MLLELMYVRMILNIKWVFAIGNEACEFYNIMSYRFVSSFLLCCDSLDYVKSIFYSWKCVICYGHDLLFESLFFEVLGVYKVSF